MESEPPLLTTRDARYPDLRGRVALVTGGSRGLGAEVARGLADNGARVAVAGRRAASVVEVAAELRRSGADAIGVAADCTDELAVQRACDEVQRRLGAISVLIAFAGGEDVQEPLVAMDAQTFRDIVDGNLLSTFLTLKVVLPGMIARRDGAVVTMASAAARRDTAASVAYTAAKAGVIGLTQKAARECAPHRVRVNCVVPSLIDTPHAPATLDPGEVSAGFPLGRVGRPEDVAAATLFLASRSAAWLTGLGLDVAGGRVM